MFGYARMLNDLNIDQEQIDIITNTLSVIDIESNNYYKNLSNIHGFGIFASKEIKKDDIIGLGVVDGIKKTLLGRYTNHSDNNNARFYHLFNNDVVMIAEKDIVKKEEILINYRDHVLNKVYLYEKYL